MSESNPAQVVRLLELAINMIDSLDYNRAGVLLDEALYHSGKNKLLTMMVNDAIKLLREVKNIHYQSVTLISPWEYQEDH